MKIGKILSKFKYLIAVGIFVLVTGFVGENCIVRRVERKQDIAELERKIQEQRDLFAADQARLDELKNNRYALRRVAREKYFMREYNEDVYIIEDEDVTDLNLSEEE